jgi:glucoamylase
LYIENDQVRIGDTVCFRNTPDLTILGTDTSTTATGGTSPTTQTAATNVAVTFSELVTTISGQTIKIVGDIDTLGCWNANNAIALSASQYTPGNPLWGATIALKAGQVIQYKYVNVQTDGSVQWEADPNHTYTVPASGATAVTKSDSWQY